MEGLPERIHELRNEVKEVGWKTDDLLRDQQSMDNTVSSLSDQIKESVGGLQCQLDTLNGAVEALKRQVDRMGNILGRSI